MTAAEPFRIVHLDDLPDVDDGRAPYRTVRHALGITTFGTIAAVARHAGDRLINEHDEAEPDSSEELYVVLSGRARFEIDDTTHDAPAGTFIRVGTGVRRTAVAEEAGTAILAVGAAPAGRVYRPSGWELFAPLLPLFASGEHAEGARRARALLQELPESATLHFNTACFESLAGEQDLALGHLTRAVELEPALRRAAAEDDDLAGLRERPEFRALTAG